MNDEKDRLLIFSGLANPELAMSVCCAKHKTPNYDGHAIVDRFPDGEVSLKIVSDVRGYDIFVVQPTCPPVNESLMELLIFIDCLRRASAKRITAVVPYYGYARKDRKDEGRVPITAKLVANLITKAGADRVLTMDLHAHQIQGFFDIPVDHLFAFPLLCSYFDHLRLEDFVVVSPDAGSIKLARPYAQRLNTHLAIVDKRRDNPTQTYAEFVIGDVKGRNVVMVDDIIATGGSVFGAAELLKRKGAQDIYVAATHPVFCGSFYKSLADSCVKKMIVTNSIPVRNVPDNVKDRIVVLDIGELLWEAIRRIHDQESVSTLLKKDDWKLNEWKIEDGVATNHDAACC